MVAVNLLEQAVENGDLVPAPEQQIDQMRNPAPPVTNTCPFDILTSPCFCPVFTGSNSSAGYRLWPRANLRRTSIAFASIFTVRAQTNPPSSLNMR